jgi:hypothetical protein
MEEESNYDERAWVYAQGQVEDILGVSRGYNGEIPFDRNELFVEVGSYIQVGTDPYFSNKKINQIGVTELLDSWDWIMDLSRKYCRKFDVEDGSSEVEQSESLRLVKSIAKVD